MSEPVRCPQKSFAVDHAGKLQNTFIAKPPADHRIEDVLSPHYFGRILSTATACMIGDLIKIEWEDMTKFGVLQVRAIDSTLELVVTALRGDLGEYARPDMPLGWTAKFANKAIGHVITCDATGYSEPGFATLEAAVIRATALARQSIVKSASTMQATRSRPAQLPGDEEEAERTPAPPPAPTVAKAAPAKAKTAEPAKTE